MLFLGYTQNKVLGTDEAHVGEMGAIITDSRLETRIKIYIYILCILMDVTAPELEFMLEKFGKVNRGS